MNIHNISHLKETAGARLDQAGQRRPIALIYAGITVAASALITVVNYVLKLQIDQTGGLANMGTRTLLSTVSTMLPLALSVFLMCLDLGYMAAMLRVSRGQYASPNSLRAGFERFWPLLRYTIVQGLIYFGLMFLSVYIAVQVFLLTPLSQPAMAILIPMTQDMEVLDAAALMENPAYNDLMISMIPVLVMTFLLYALLAIPVAYRYRMTRYVLLDKPGIGALAAMRESKKMMLRNRFSLFRVDLSFWWFYALSFLASCVCYGDSLLPMVGIDLPFPAAVSYFLFYGLYLAAMFGIYYCLRGHVEVTYALAYEALKPEEPKNNEIILGNIFQM